MSLNPSIILAGANPDILGAMSRGNELAAQTNTLRDQNALRQVYQTQGAGLLQGNQSSLNALAAIDPNLALGVQGGVLQNQTAQRQFEIMNAQEKRAIAEAAAQMDEAQKAAAAEATRRQVQQFVAAPSPEVWDQLVTQAGKPELRGQWANRQVIAAEYVSSVEEALALSQGPEQANPADRFKVVGSQLWDLQAEGGPAVVGEAPGQTETIFGPDGQPILQRGPAQGVKFTEGQGKDNVYSTRAEGALAKLEPVADALASRSETILQSVPLGIGRELQTPEFQIARQAGDEFLQAILRKDTGAAITADEQELYGVTYLPQPGDGPAVLQAKREARARAIAALQSGMNADQFAATERALVDAARRIEQANGANPAAPAADAPRRLRYNPETGALE